MTRAFVLIAFVALAARAHAFAFVGDETTGLVDVNWHITIEGEIARTVIDLTLATVNDEPVNGDVLFALPRGAVLHRSSISDDDGQSFVVAHTHGAGPSTDYDFTWTPWRTPPMSVLVVRELPRENDDDTYVAHVLVDPKRTTHVRLETANLLERRGKERILRVPLREDPYARCTNVATVRIDVDPADIEAVELANDVGQITSAADVQGVTEVSLPCSTAADDLVIMLTPRGERPDVAAAGYRSGDARVKPHVMVHGAPFARLPAPSTMPRTVIFIVDQSVRESGDAWWGEAPIGTLQYLVDALAPGDRFSAVFAGHGNRLLEGLVVIDEATRATIDTYERTEFTGLTDLTDCVDDAFAIVDEEGEGVQHFDLVVIHADDRHRLDAPPEDVSAHIDARAAERGVTVRVSALGVAAIVDANYFDVLSWAHAGFSFIVADDTWTRPYARELMHALAPSSRTFVRTDLSEENSIVVQAQHRALGIEDLLVVGTDQIGQPRALSLAVTVSAPFDDAVRHDLNVPSPPFSSTGAALAIPSLLARAQVRTISEDLVRVREGEDPARVDAIRAIGTHHGIVTRYTAHFVQFRDAMHGLADWRPRERDEAGVAKKTRNVDVIATERLLALPPRGAFPVSNGRGRSEPREDSSCTCTATPGSPRTLAFVFAIALGAARRLRGRRHLTTVQAA
jgi:hypothetical protein